MSSDEIVTVESPLQAVANWDRMNEGTAISGPVVISESWERLEEIWTAKFGPDGTGEKVVLMHDSPCAPLSNTNDTSEVSGSEEEDTSWISSFCSLPGNEFLSLVDDYFILDDCNFSGLRRQVPHYNQALKLILDEEPSPDGDVITEEDSGLIKAAAEKLYGMLHARYLVTLSGLHSALNKYYEHEFGRCPRVYCLGQACLPIGLSDIPGESTVKIYCPKCEDVYEPRSDYHSNIDGAYFGTTFPHLFLMTYPFQCPKKVSQSYVPRVFGFKLHKP